MSTPSPFDVGIANSAAAVCRDQVPTAHTISTLVAVLVGLGACASTGTPEPRRSVCRPAGAALLVGRGAPDDATILHGTGSAIVRRIAPGDVATTEYRGERVTVTIAEGQVVAASCG
ncbi:MAG: hypothetical protein EOO77_04500 [Oxalobacteraceae bacterium]|nr:MAG: hypothetical protein EOO77_04500 [Oxalobacteraceae bacterium]